MKTGTLAAYLEVIDYHEICDAIVSSYVIEIGQAIQYKLEQGN